MYYKISMYIMYMYLKKEIELLFLYLKIKNLTKLCTNLRFIMLNL